MAAIGVVGLGNIGGAIASNLVEDGHTVAVFDLDGARMAAVAGATAAGSVAGVASACDITITSLPTPQAIEAAATEWAAAAAPGAVLLDMSTTAPASNRALADRLAAGGHHFVEAPLTGGAVGAHSRSLVFMVGGEDEPVARVRPVLDALGRATFHLGPVGTGSTMKLVNSLLAFACTWASLEALSMAAAAGIDLRDAVEVVRTGGASNFYIDRAVEGINTRGRPPQFSLALAAKDADLIHSLGDSPFVEALAGVFRDAVERGMGDRDWSDLVELAEQRAGVELRLRPSPP